MKRRITAKIHTGKKSGASYPKAKKIKTIPSMRQRGLVK